MTLEADAQAAQALTLTVHGTLSQDADKGITRLDPADFSRLGARAGDVLAIKGGRIAHARALPAPARFRGKGVILLDGTARANAQIAVDASAEIRLAAPQPAARIVLAPTGESRAPGDTPGLARAQLENAPLSAGDQVRLRLLGGRRLELKVLKTEPDGPVLPGPETRFVVEAVEGPAESVPAAPAYEDLGGLGPILARVREMAEWPLRRADLFERLGVDPPRGVLFSGPPGTGKTLLARAVARECGAAFFQISGPEIVTKHYGDSEARLRKLFEAARARAPAIIFIDEIDAIAPKREVLSGERQVERRIIAQLLTLMDGLKDRGRVLVMAATNMPDSLDPALRRPGRFDREIVFPVPDRAARAEILAVHACGAPLAEDVDLDRLAEITHGYVGADLAALVREAAMAALRRVADEAGGDPGAIGAADLALAQDDFAAALKDVGPSALREAFIDIPPVSWADVGGYDDVKQALIEAVIQPLRYPELCAVLGVEPERGILLSGPPGMGKTHIAKALAHEAGLNFIAVRGAQLLSPHFGEAERAVRSVFQKARHAAPAILFFDELDALAPVRGPEAGAAMERVVAQLLTEIDGVEPLAGVFLLAATNRADRIDPALLRAGRFGRVIALGPPDTCARKAIFTVHLKPLPLTPKIDLAERVSRTEGWSPADIHALCRGAARAALRRILILCDRSAVDKLILGVDFEAAFSERKHV